MLEALQRHQVTLLAYVVMDDHVHLILRQHPEYPLSQLVHTWKSYTAHAINKRREANAKVWLNESFDRIIRDQLELDEKLKYVLTNPQKRWPDIKDYQWVDLLASE